MMEKDIHCYDKIKLKDQNKRAKILHGQLKIQSNI